MTVRPPWHRGRTFYACHCGARSEHHAEDGKALEFVPCWNCRRVMEQWVPQSVRLDRERGIV